MLYMYPESAKTLHNSSRGHQIGTKITMSEFSCEATNHTRGSTGRDRFLLGPEEHVLPWVYLGLAIFGLLLNGVALTQLCRSKRTATVIFILNIMVSDVMVCCSFPFQTAFYTVSAQWNAGSAICIAAKFVIGACFYINFYCNIGFLLWMSINRYTVVVQLRSALFQAFCRPRHCWVICFATWTLGVASVCSSMGYTLNKYFTTQEQTSCRYTVLNVRPEELNRVFATGVGIFFFTLALMLLSYGLMILHLQKVTAQSLVSRGRLRVRRKILASVGIFMVCFLPYHMQRARMMRGAQDCDEIHADLRAKELTKLVAAFSTCLHPALQLIFRLPCCRAQLNVRTPAKPDSSLCACWHGALDLSQTTNEEQ